MTRIFFGAQKFGGEFGYGLRLGALMGYSELN